MKRRRLSWAPSVSWLGGLAVLVWLGGCLDTASLNNDQGTSDPNLMPSPGGGNGPAPGPPGDGDSSGPAPSGDGDSSGPAPSGDGDSSGPVPSGDGDSSGPAPSGDGDSSGPAPSGDGDSSGPAPSGDGDSGGPAGDGDGEKVLMPELTAGTAIPAGCASEALAEGGMCGSWFCGVDAETLDKGLDPNGACGENMGNMGGIDFVCEARPVKVVGDCARMVKSSMPFATNEQLRPLVRDCVYQDAEIKANVTEPCLNCFIDVADCAGTYCLLQCLASADATCDQCRLDNNCDQPLFDCAGFPNPF